MIGEISRRRLAGVVRLSLHCFTFFFFSVFFSGVGNCQEIGVLLKLKDALQHSSPTGVFDSWSATDVSPCKWVGIACDARGFVTEIGLRERKLAGSFGLESLCELRWLRKIDLSRNHLSGKISSGINNCTGLQHLDVSFNGFNGEVPDLWNLAELKCLNLSDNRFSGVFPAGSLRNKSNLEWLSLGDNDFDPSPFPKEILGLQRLRWLYLSDTNLLGKIPREIGGLTELLSLELADNSLDGEIPVEITRLTKLWQLELYNNSLTGNIPEGFGNLYNLELFDASMNGLVGNLSELRNLTKLVTLQLYRNQLSGPIPTEFGDFRRLTNFSLYSNWLTGPLPRKLGSWTEFDFIDVSDNLLTGQVPPNMCAKGTMKRLLILNNQFTGGIPSTYANCKSLLRFRVANNSLSGEIPAGIWGLPNVVIIDLTQNSFTGKLTPDIKNAQSLAEFFISNNKFTGVLPVEISQVLSLKSIDVSNNILSGGIPSSIGQLKNLNRFKLEKNSFSGILPDSLGSCVALNEINLAANRFSGKIPSTLGNILVLNSLNLSGNELSGEIPQSISLLKLSLLDLSNNRLTGPIPPALSVEAYNGSFGGNPGLCSVNGGTLRICSSHPSSSSYGILLSCFTVAGALLLASVVLFLYMKRRKRDDSSFRDRLWDLKSFRVLTFTEQEIINAIKAENRIGKGGSGEVYRVDLDNRSTVAVKHISHPEPAESHRATAAILSKDNSKWKEFDAEVNVLSSIRHVNIVKLFCSITNNDSSLLVYEYLPNGSLFEQLHGGGGIKGGLDWPTRYKIAVGAARGLEYLHHGCGDQPVLHRDVKSSNILLDEFFQARIADFGLAKITKPGPPADWSAQAIAGTQGYIAPEYAYTYRINEKSDVYSFGVVLMELVTGKRPTGLELGTSKDLVDWISARITTRASVMGLVDPKIPAELREEVVKVMKVGVLCTARTPNMRPTMKAVVQMLEEIREQEPHVYLYRVKSDHKQEEDDPKENPCS